MQTKHASRGKLARFLQALFIRHLHTVSISCVQDLQLPATASRSKLRAQGTQTVNHKEFLIGFKNWMM